MEEVERQRIVITGGGGFVGLNLCREVLEADCEVILVDLFPPRQLLPPRCTFAQGDIADAAFMKKACEGATTIFHLASYGMSGLESLERARIQSVNVQGTANALAAASAAGAAAFVYVSTYNTVFIDTPIAGGDEETPTHPLQEYKDDYSRTKAAAEAMVLAANGTTNTRGNVLRTCVIRPAAIYGPGETRHFPRILNNARQGLLRFVFGDPGSLVDWVHVRNLVAALRAAEARILVEAGRAKTRRTAVAGTEDEAAEAGGEEAKDRERGQDGLLTVGDDVDKEEEEEDDKEREERREDAGVASTVGGQAFFISDGRPVNNFEFIRPVLEGCGYEYPRLRLPYGVMLAMAHVMEAVHRAMLERLGLRLQPLLTPTEVRKCAVTHYFKIDKARKLLQYNPKEYDNVEIISSYEHMSKRAKKPCASDGDAKKGLSTYYLSAAVLAAGGIGAYFYVNS